MIVSSSIIVLLHLIGTRILLLLDLDLSSHNRDEKILIIFFISGDYYFRGRLWRDGDEYEPFCGWVPLVGNSNKPPYLKLLTDLTKA